MPTVWQTFKPADTMPDNDQGHPLTIIYVTPASTPTFYYNVTHVTCECYDTPLGK